MSKIHWSHAERLKLRDEMTRLLAGGYKYGDTALLRDAQLALPEWRRRKIEGSVLSSMRPWVDEAKNQVGRDKPQAPQPTSPAAPAPTQPDSPSLAGILAALIESLSDEVARKVIAQLELRQHCKLPTPIQEQIAAAERPNRPGVLIVGLLDGQAAAVIQVFPELNITHLTADEALRREPLNRAHVVLMTKFIDHAVQDKYRRAPRLHYCNGGVSALSATLHQILTEESKQ